ncbi:MAG TPA: hypothetical protein EYN51_01165 [Flavobacteriales bacterium]|nr:hypothetical protein [Flavobacteriales bacterium]
MVVKKILILTSDTGIIATLGVAFDGPALPVTFALVNGFQSFDNASFTLNASTGELTVPIALTKGRYHFRYKATLNDNGFLSQEGTGIVDVDTEIAPTISGSLEYDAGIAPGTIVATVASNFDSPLFAMYPAISGGGNPAPPSASSDFEIDQATGEISWTGDGTASNEYQYSYEAVAIAGGSSGCFKGTVLADITFNDTSLSPAICVFSGLGTIAATALLDTGVQTFTDDQFVQVKTALDDSSTVPVNAGLFAGYRNNFGAGGGFTGLQRRYLTINTLGITDKISCRIQWSCNQINREFVIVYTIAAEPAVNNVTFDMPSWTVLGTIINPNSASETIDFDCDALPRNATLRVGFMMINDFENDITGMTGVNIPANGFRLGSAVFYRCP